MSRSFGVKILLPMDQYNSDEVYTADERLEKVSGKGFQFLVRCYREFSLIEGIFNVVNESHIVCFFC